MEWNLWGRFIEDVQEHMKEIMVEPFYHEIPENIRRVKRRIIKEFLKVPINGWTFEVRRSAQIAVITAYGDEEKKRIMEDVLSGKYRKK